MKVTWTDTGTMMRLRKQCSHGNIGKSWEKVMLLAMIIYLGEEADSRNAGDYLNDETLQAYKAQ